MTSYNKIKIFRVSFTWLGSDKGDYIDVMAESPYSACDYALKIKQGFHKSNYTEKDIWKVELISEVQTIV